MFPKLWLAACLVALIAGIEGNPCLGIYDVTNVPDPVDCTRFYICVNGQSFPSQCANDLIFDVVTQQCNRVEDAICVVDLPPIPTAGPEVPTEGPAVPTEPGQPSEEPTDGETLPPAPTAPTEATTAGPIPTAPTEGPGTPAPGPTEATTEAPAAPTPGPAPTTEPPTAPTPAPTLPPVTTTEAPTTTTAAPPAPTPSPTTEPTTASPTTEPPAPTTEPPAPTTPPPAPTTAPVTTTTPPIGGVPTCNIWEDFYAPHPDCTRFFRCFFGTLHVLECPPNQYWNQAQQWCDHPWNVNCPASG